MKRIDSLHRDQLTLFPNALEDSIHPENPILSLDSLLYTLDLV